MWTTNIYMEYNLIYSNETIMRVFVCKNGDEEEEENQYKWHTFSLNKQYSIILNKMREMEKIKKKIL